MSWRCPQADRVTVSLDLMLSIISSHPLFAFSQTEDVSLPRAPSASIMSTERQPLMAPAAPASWFARSASTPTSNESGGGGKTSSASEARHHALTADDVPSFSFTVTTCFCLNYIIGTGFLTLPWGFYVTGVPLGLFLLGALTVFSMGAALCILEAMARAEVYATSTNRYRWPAWNALRRLISRHLNPSLPAPPPALGRWRTCRTWAVRRRLRCVAGRTASCHCGPSTAGARQTPPPPLPQPPPFLPSPAHRAGTLGSWWWAKSASK